MDGRRRQRLFGPRKPAWLRIAAPAPAAYRSTAAVLDDLRLPTVCREARCPNRGECFAHATATFLLLGDVCTRGCRFCGVTSNGLPPNPASSAGGRAAGPRAVEPDEPDRVAEAAARLGLRHVVITSVTRDDLADGGAGQFAAAVVAVRRRLPEATVEVLVPDLGGDVAALRAVLATAPDVLAHNLETVPRLYARVRPGADYSRSLALLRAASDAGTGRRPRVKTGLMVGLGERDGEVLEVLRDCADAGAELVTIGQYLQPSRDCLPVHRFVPPHDFRRLALLGRDLALRVQAGPFVRSSYHAAAQLRACG